MTISDVLTGSPYVAYGYAYPHKTAYRPLDTPRRLRDVWRHERKHSLFLYIHVPFCEMRCGFCNLFTTTQSKDLRGQYLDALRRQAGAVLDELGPMRCSRLAIGGGTPSLLNPGELEQLLKVASELMGSTAVRCPASVEVSPTTATRERLQILRAFGVERVSIGVQVFDEAEARGLGRPQCRTDVHQALHLIRETGFATLNMDLIYGGQGQTVDSWLATLEAALAYVPEELYLYPLYVRPLTHLGRMGHAWDDQRLEAYRAGRDFLCSRGYRQHSMRMFRAARAPQTDGPIYCCQTDGMIGLGAGARSYTTRLHYSGEYAVGREDVRRIIAGYVDSTESHFGEVSYGFSLDAEEHRRRFIIKSLLRSEGLDCDAYRGTFAADPKDDLPQLTELVDNGLAESDEERLQLTAAGLERSDAIAPWLYSSRVRRLMESYTWR